MFVLFDFRNRPVMNSVEYNYGRKRYPANVGLSPLEKVAFKFLFSFEKKKTTQLAVSKELS